MRTRNLAISFALATAFTAGISLSGARADGPKPCINAKQQTAQVQAACDRGGLDEAKKFMKTVLEKGKKTNAEMKCQSCHKDLKTFALTDNGMADFKKLL